MRSMVRETHLRPGALIYPLFLCEGEGVRREISSMPGAFNLSIDEALKEIEVCASLGLGGVLLFGIPGEKDEQGSGAWAADGIVMQPRWSSSPMSVSASTPRTAIAAS
jgi:porphobilinogen synthase